METLERKCCIPECTRTPASVMTATKDSKTLRFYACIPHEPAVWKHTIRKYSKEGYEMKVMNLMEDSRHNEYKS